MLTFVLEHSKEVLVLSISVCKRVVKLQTIKFFDVTFFVILCSKSLLIRSLAFFLQAFDLQRPIVYVPLERYVLIDVQSSRGVRKARGNGLMSLSLVGFMAINKLLPPIISPNS